MRWRYWQYEYAQHGLVAPGDNLRAAFGIAQHDILACALEDPDHLDEAIDGAALNFINSIGEQGEPWEFDRERTLKEQVNALRVIGACAIPEVARFVLNQFKLLSTESEHKVSLIPEVAWYSREDALLQNQDDKRIIFSFKTVEEFSSWNHLKGAQFALQNMTEPWAAAEDDVEDVAGVLMCWLEVGRLFANKQEGFYERDTPFIRPWLKDEDVRIFWKWKWAGSQVPKGHKKSAIYDYMPLQDWIDFVRQDRVIPAFTLQDGTRESLLIGKIYGPVYYEVNEDYSEHRIDQLKIQESHAAYGAARTQAALESGDLLAWKECLDAYWPQNEQSCNKCPFTQLCWGGERGLTQIGTTFKIKESSRRREAITG